MDAFLKRSAPAQAAAAPATTPGMFTKAQEKPRYVPWIEK